MMFAKIIKHYENHSSIPKIRENQHGNLTFDFPKATVGNINKIIKFEEKQ